MPPQTATLTDDELAKKYATDAPAGTVDEDALIRKYGDGASNIASEKEMAAHPPTPPAGDVHEVASLPLSRDTLRTRLQSMGKEKFPRTPGSDEEAIREGSVPAIAGLTTIGAAGGPIKAIT